MSPVGSEISDASPLAHELTRDHHGPDGFVGRAYTRRVLDADDATTGDTSGEGDPTGSGGEDQRTCGRGEIDAPMTGGPPDPGRLEFTVDDHRTAQGGAPAGAGRR